MKDHEATSGLSTQVSIFGDGDSIKSYEVAAENDSFMRASRVGWMPVTSTVKNCDFDLERAGFEQLQQTNTELVQQVATQTALLQISNAQLLQSRQLSEHLRETLEADRTRISREIHDQLGQVLTGLKFDVAFIKGRVKHDLVSPIDLQTIRTKAVEMMTLIDSTIETVRDIAADLRPSILDDLGLVAALEWHAETFQNRTGVLCEVVSNASDVPLDRIARTNLFRIAQEALTNVTRHAQATQVYMTLIEEEDALVFEVRDNGVGIVKNDHIISKSLGLLGIEERARLLGGTAQVTSEVNKGTTVVIRIPLDSNCSQA